MFRLARSVVEVCRKRRGANPEWSGALVSAAREELLESTDTDTELRNGIRALIWVSQVLEELGKMPFAKKICDHISVSLWFCDMGVCSILSSCRAA